MTSPFAAIDFKAGTLPRPTKILLLAAVVLLFLAQALPLLNTRWVEDESWYSAAAESLARHGELRMPIFADDALTAQVDTRPPLTAITMAGFFKLLGTSLYSAKLPFLLSGIAGLFLTYLLGCELGSPLLGVLGALFLAADNLYMIGARTARPEAFVTALSLAGILLYLWSQRRNSTGLALLSGITVGLALLSHMNGFAAAITIFILALREDGLSLVRRPRPWVFLAGLVLAVAPFFVWVNLDAVHHREFINLYSSGEGYPLSAIPSIERSRWSDFVGMPNSRFRLPIPLPYRLHAALALAAALFLLFRYNRRLFYMLAALIVPAVLWYAYERNPTSRYIATAAPYLSLLLAGGFLAAVPRWRRLATAAMVCVLLAEVASTYAVEYLYRKANYSDVTRQLREIVPPDATVYAALTFWMSFHDQPFYSWNRTPVRYAADRGATYLVVNDRVLVNGSGFGLDDWAARRQEIQDFVSAHATLAGRVSNPFYGDLEIYRITGK